MNPSLVSLRDKSQARLCGFTKTSICGNAGCGHSNTIYFTNTIMMGDLGRGMPDPEVKAMYCTGGGGPTYRTR